MYVLCKHTTHCLVCCPSTCRGGHITAEYKTLQLKLAQDVSGDKVLRPVPSEGQGWIPVCSSQDANCLSCVQF